MGMIQYNVSALFLILVMNIILAGCANNPNPATQTSKEKKAVERGTLVGKVTRGPGSPVETKDQPSLKPAAGVKLLILTAAGEEINSVVTDDQGMYRISLPTGIYQVELAPLASIEFTKDLPATVTIAEGQETRLDISIDTGIR